MKALRTVKMVWERRLRGAYPVSRHALGDDGTLTLAIPRPLEARTYDLTRVRTDGGADVRTGFAAETLIKLDVTSQADSFLGMTTDDVYLFQPGKKSRFLAERRISYVDAVLSADGERLAAAFSDIAGASYALALGEIGGRAAWLRDVDSPVTAVAMSRDGTRMAIGDELGMIWLIDSARRDIWQFQHEPPSPIRALACSQDGLLTAYGAEDGTVGLVDGNGTRRWGASLGANISVLVLSGNGDIAAALCPLEEDPPLTRVSVLHGDDGHVGWEYEADRVVLGLSVSADGRYLATSARSGHVSLYEIIPAEARSALHTLSAAESAVEKARENSADGDLEGAYVTLRSALEKSPADLTLFDAYLGAGAKWRETRLAEARALTASAAFSEAIALLNGMLAVEPCLPDATHLLSEARTEYADALLADARRCVDQEKFEAADDTYCRAIAANPTLADARRELAALRERRAAAALAEAEKRLAEGALGEGIGALERAQSLAPSQEIADKLYRAQTAGEFAEGMELYRDKRYREAVFQFKKTIVRYPGHREAQRYLGYAKKFLQDTDTADIFDRFSRLE